jgi:hypothetical protein
MVVIALITKLQQTLIIQHSICQEIVHRCHTTNAGWRPTSFNHAVYYPLTGAHASVANNCTACHKGDVKIHQKIVTVVIMLPIITPQTPTTKRLVYLRTVQVVIARTQGGDQVLSTIMFIIH